MTSAYAVPTISTLVVMVLAFGASPAVAQFVWNNTNAADTNWTSTANWAGGVVPGAANDVTLGTSFAGPDVTLSASHDVRSLSVDTPSDFTMSSGTLTLNGLGLSRSVASSGTQTITSAVSIVAAATNNGLWTVDGSGRLVVSGNIALGTSGSAATNFTKAGNGTLELTGSNTFLGISPTIAVTGGTLVLTNGTNNDIATWTIGTASGQVANLAIAGGQVLSGSISAAAQLSIGDAAGSTGTMAVSGGARVGTAGPAASGPPGFFYVGNNGNGTLTVDDTATYFRVQRTNIGNVAGSAGAVTVNSGTYFNTRNFFLGENGTGAFTLNGGQTNVSSNIFIGGQATGSGTMTVTGGTMSIGASSYVGENGTGSFTLAGGTASMGQGAWVGNKAGSIGTLTVTGGTMSIGSTSAHATTIGGLGNGTMAISGGTVTSRDAFIGRGLDNTGTNAGTSSRGVATVSGGSWRTIGNLQVGGTIGSGTGTLTINGSGSLSVGGTLSLGGTGKITLAPGGTLMIGGDASNVGGGVLATDLINHGTLVFNSSADTTYGFELSGTSGSLVKSNTATLTLSGTSTYTGSTSVSAGRLAVDGFLAHTPVTVLATATLGGSGALAGTVSVSAGGALAPGNSIESLETGAVLFASAATFAYEVDSTNLSSLTSAADLLMVGWLTGDLTLDPGNGTILTFADIAGSSQPFVEDTTFAMINYEGTWNGGLFTYGGSVLADDSLFTAGSQQWRIDYNSPTGGVNFTGDYLGGDSLFVTVTAVPEPSTLALATVGGGLAWLAARRIPVLRRGDRRR